ncbi:Platelet-activating factor acetylhydrolase IB subunit beta [Seminavis robusta]|uniref:Platelet-activating factor acetylhydrolase IB subunit beta n=1 Tax=Seminavis robusta TaxID=568900 RepID=A0A9N8DCH3_9STRA|nr:Platelet-activating factor acetylhydrolase IB subunit beta [Seminavis robusta]|eukprot:Sro89_g046920.1 Platelet-activating factor acetylhydrolase IB subunit beta (468) ;mRNA; r:55966-57495
MSSEDDEESSSKGETDPLETGGGCDNGEPPQTMPFQPFGGLCSLISSHLSYLWFAYPVACRFVSYVVSLVVMTFLLDNMINPTLRFGDMPTDWAAQRDMLTFYRYHAEVQHWCLGCGKPFCSCGDPLLPASRVESPNWTKAFQENKLQISEYVENHLNVSDLDVAFIGESAVEAMGGRWMGLPKDELKTIGNIFEHRFSKDKGASVEGITLGLAGDSTKNVLYRLIHGEMPRGFEPKIWWVHVGMNDLAREQCSEELVVLGVLRVVEEILNRHPKARVVINALLPMAALPSAQNEMDCRDATHRHNPTMDKMKHKQKKFKFFRFVEREMPLWTSIYATNKQLFKYSELHDRVAFFDATHIFAERQSDSRGRYFTLLSDYIDTCGHPTEAGYSRWEDAMVHRIQYLLSELREGNPELFVAAPKMPEEKTGAKEAPEKPMMGANDGQEADPPVPEAPKDEVSVQGETPQ